MGKTIDPKELKDGLVQLKDLLTEEDFKMARSVIVHACLLLPTVLTGAST